ncbi:hypothetical protein ACMYLL_23225, partial [Salmonella enterica subsp. enterica serovar Enteritidis]|uniref:hypothetical protein n=1 Tax=Salmonella enterica TaxID=28901 RepID=UPI0039EB8118
FRRQDQSVDRVLEGGIQGGLQRIAHSGEMSPFLTGSSVHPVLHEHFGLGEPRLNCYDCFSINKALDVKHLGLCLLKFRNM